MSVYDIKVPLAEEAIIGEIGWDGEGIVFGEGSYHGEKSDNVRVAVLMTGVSRCENSNGVSSGSQLVYEEADTLRNAVGDGSKTVREDGDTQVFHSGFSP